jgi:hypothetical protein
MQKQKNSTASKSLAKVKKGPVKTRAKNLAKSKAKKSQGDKMSNKYLTKVAEKLRDPDRVRMAGRGLAYGALGAAAGSLATNAIKAHPASIIGILGTAGLGGMAAYQGVRASKKNQLREQDNHDIKLQGATQRQEMHEARMKKMAEIQEDPKRHIKDIVNTGVIAGLGGVGSSVAQKLTTGHWGGAKGFGIGTGVGLVADYAGVKLNNMINKKIDSRGQTKIASVLGDLGGRAAEKLNKAADPHINDYVNNLKLVKEQIGKAYEKGLGHGVAGTTAVGAVGLGAVKLKNKLSDKKD